MVSPGERDRYERALARVRQLRGFYIHAAVYAIVNAGLLIINLLTSPNSLWFFWPLVGWGIGLAAHAFSVFGTDRLLGRDWEERKLQEYMREEPPGPPEQPG